MGHIMKYIYTLFIVTIIMFVLLVNYLLPTYPSQQPLPKGNTMKYYMIMMALLIMIAVPPVYADTDGAESGYKQVSVHNKDGTIVEYYDSENPVHRRESPVKVVELCIHGTLWYYTENSLEPGEDRTPLVLSYEQSTGKPFACDRGGPIAGNYNRQRLR